MQEPNRETVIVDNNRGGSYGWLVAVGVIVLLVILFFTFGGASMFNGSGAQTINVDTPDAVNVQPTN